LLTQPAKSTSHFTNQVYAYCGAGHGRKPWFYLSELIAWRLLLRKNEALNFLNLECIFMSDIIKEF
jgi:hypothetical protein